MTGFAWSLSPGMVKVWHPQNSKTSLSLSLSPIHLHAAFCAGADLTTGNVFNRKKERTTISEHRDGGGRVTLAIQRCRKPVIAAINGSAVGVGITMTLPMDIRIAAEDAKVG